MADRPVGALALAALVALLACGDSPAGPDPDDSDGTMSATIEGSSWTATTAAAGRAAGLVTLSGSDDSGLSIDLSLQASTPGTYTIGTALVSAVLSDGSASWSASSGEVVLTVLTGAFTTGTFTFDADLATGSGAATRTVTNGAFDIRF